MPAVVRIRNGLQVLVITKQTNSGQTLREVLKLTGTALNFDIPIFTTAMVFAGKPASTERLSAGNRLR
jgi:hypothetical protein